MEPADTDSQLSLGNIIATWSYRALYCSVSRGKGEDMNYLYRVLPSLILNSSTLPSLPALLCWWLGPLCSLALSHQILVLPPGSWLSSSPFPSLPHIAVPRFSAHYFYKSPTLHLLLLGSVSKLPCRSLLFFYGVSEQVLHPSQHHECSSRLKQNPAMAHSCLQNKINSLTLNMRLAQSVPPVASPAPASTALKFSSPPLTSFLQAYRTSTSSSYSLTMLFPE